MAAATGGAGGSLLGTTSTTAAGASATTLGTTTLATTTAAGVTSYTTAGLALNAGFTALSSQAAVAFVNNGGDIGKTLNQLGSTESIRNTLVAMGTAGALNELTQNIQFAGKSLSAVKAADGFAANLYKNVVTNLAGATINSTLTGAPLDDSLKIALTGALISASAGQAANTIGDMTVPDPSTGETTLNPVGQALAHALAGCVAGAAGGSSQGCQSGAIGATVGELAAQWYNPSGDPNKADETLNFVKVIAATAGAIAGDGSAQSVNTATLTGTNAAQNNFLNHAQQRSFANELNSCKTNAQCNAVIAKYQQISDTNNATLAKAQALCDSTGDCASRDNLYASGMAWGQGLTTVGSNDDPEAASINPSLASNNAQNVQELIDRPLAQEVTKLSEATSFDAAGNVQVDAARFVSAIDNRNATSVMTVAMAPSLLLPGPEDLAIGAALATKSGQFIAKVAMENGAKVWRFLDGTTAKVGSQEAEAIARARIENNFYAEGASSAPAGLNTSAGVIPANPNKTTTVLGRWKTDMSQVIGDSSTGAAGQLNPGSTFAKTDDFGPKPGGFNVLNVSKSVEDAAGTQFFEKVNKPFLDEAIKRGDDIALGTIPTVKDQIIFPKTGALNGNFAKEINYLVHNNYKPVNVGSAQWETIKGWLE